jgi:hypothetical protein
VRFPKRAVLQAVAALMRERFGVRAVPRRRFDWTEGVVTADLYLPPPLHCLVQFDGATRCTRERARTIAAYPPDTPLSYDTGRYLADRRRGSRAVASREARADLLPPRHELNPTVRLRADELAELTGPLPRRVAALLDQRLALNAGTEFQRLLDNAGAKPHGIHFWRQLADQPTTR